MQISLSICQPTNEYLSHMPYCASNVGWGGKSFLKLKHKLIPFFFHMRNGDWRYYWNTKHCRSLSWWTLDKNQSIVCMFNVRVFLRCNSSILWIKYGPQYIHYSIQLAKSEKILVDHVLQVTFRLFSFTNPDT